VRKYSIIYADPPWQFKNYSDRWHEKHPESKWVGRQYGLMSLADVCSLPVEQIAADDCVLMLWSTMPHLPDALKVIAAWGFTYKTVAFTWVKQNKSGNGTFTGMGFWTRSNAEVCLLATRGRPKRLSKSVRQVIISPVQRHSQKPAEVRQRIFELMGDLPRIELFARERVAGWDAWGDEVKSDIDLLESAR
jgi:site-specific DNA-methyltransferase (adenine-specific)